MGLSVVGAAERQPIATKFVRKNRKVDALCQLFDKGSPRLIASGI